MTWYYELWGYFLLISFILFIFAIIAFEFGNKTTPSVGFWLLLLATFATLILAIALYAYQVQLPKIV